MGQEKHRKNKLKLTQFIGIVLLILGGFFFTMGLTHDTLPPDQVEIKDQTVEVGTFQESNSMWRKYIGIAGFVGGILLIVTPMFKTKQNEPVR